MHNAATSSGNGTDAELTDNTQDFAIQISGISGDTVAFQGSFDGSVFTSIALRNAATGAIATSATADGTWELPYPQGRFTDIRCPLTRVSGTVTVKARIGTLA